MAGGCWLGAGGLFVWHRTWNDLKKEEDIKGYIKFLQESQKVYYLGDFPWVKYQGALRPAIPIPYEPPQFSLRELENLLETARVPFLRWWDSFTARETGWWWLVATPPASFATLSKKVRNEVRRGLNRCYVEKIKPEFLLENGYEVYLSAFKRYRYTKGLDRETYTSLLEQKEKFPFFEFWGVFAGEKLIGYCECIILARTATTSVIKYHPDYLNRQYSPGYLLIWTIIDHYLNERNFRLVINGERSIAHDTNIQEFLERKFGFTRLHCRLNLLYSFPLRLCLKVAFPLRNILKAAQALFPKNTLIHKTSVLLQQEKICRSFYAKATP